MSVSPTVLLLLTACWFTPALTIAVVYAVGRGSSSETGSTEMSTSVEGIRTDILQLDVEAPRQTWRRGEWEGPGARVRAEIGDASHEMTVLTPYAEASVTVQGPDDRPERRRCSLCLN
ncbi:MAG: hypothetical protein ABEL97_09770 [Salinibacter sp.]